MELRVSPEKPGFSSSDVASDTEKEISEAEDEDDDRNHKHRRRDAHSESLEGDSLDQHFPRPYRKRNRPFENGYSYREGDPQSGETWKNYNNASDRGFPSRFDRRRLNQASFSKAPPELNQRIRGNQMLPGEVGPVRGRGREHVPWGIRDSRFGLVDVASQIVQPGPVPSAMFGGRGFPNVSNSQGTSWNAFGLIPGIHNGGLDSLHPLSLQGALRPAISPPVNIQLPRQRCRDFEERGFCLRGDMCPMEHGVNRIVVEDVQSLSQFNLPVSIPGSQLLGASSGHGALPVNTKAFHSKSNKTGMSEDGFGLNGGASDVYDPDQPLWANDNPETSAALLAINQSNAADETEPFLDVDHNESVEGFSDDRQLRNATTGGSQSSSVWGRINSSKHNLGAKEKIESVGTSSSYLERDGKSEKALSMGRPDVPNQRKWENIDGNCPPVKESSVKKHGDSVRDNTRKPTQKALRTLFVYGVPLKDNKREALLSHFQKFGEVIDIYIPANGERAFVQFSKREEAEAALMAPDAVMGNRFVKLWWANRDNIPDNGINHNQFFPDKGKENPHFPSGKDGNANASISQQPPVHDHPKLVVGISPKAPPPPQQNKLENLELLKEELRKKQEMLDQKRNEFRRQLDKLEKQAVVVKDVTASDLTPKRRKSETPPIHAKSETSKSSPRPTMATENTSSAELALPHTSSANPMEPAQELLKVPFRPQVPLGAPFLPYSVNKFKLDNRPTTFRIVSPLPSGLTDAAALEEHFSAFGDLSSVELQESNDASVSSDVSARVSFTTRRSAEKAFLHGKMWQGHKLVFVWLTGKEVSTSGNPPSAFKLLSNTNVQPSGVDASAGHQETIEADASAGHLETVEADASAGHQETVEADASAGHQETVEADASAGHQETVEADAGSVEPDKDRESKSTTTSSSSESKRSSCS